MTMPELWYRNPKVHLSVVADVSRRMLSTWSFDDIYDEVVKSGIKEDDDILATTRHLRDLRNHRREVLQNA